MQREGCRETCGHHQEMRTLITYLIDKAHTLKSRDLTNQESFFVAFVSYDNLGNQGFEIEKNQLLEQMSVQPLPTDIILEARSLYQSLFLIVIYTIPLKPVERTKPNISQGSVSEKNTSKKLVKPTVFVKIGWTL